MIFKKILEKTIEELVGIPISINRKPFSEIVSYTILCNNNQELTILLDFKNKTKEEISILDYFLDENGESLQIFDGYIEKLNRVFKGQEICVYRDYSGKHHGTKNDVAGVATKVKKEIKRIELYMPDECFMIELYIGDTEEVSFYLEEDLEW